MLMLLEQSPAILITLTALFSLLVGSFLNVVIYRYPKMMKAAWRAECLEFLEMQAEPKPAKKFNLMTPASTCGSCNTPIKPWHNIPVLSWILLRGKCANCSAPYSIRYPLVEAATGILAGLIAWQIGFDAMLLPWLFFLFMLISLAMIDADTTYLPDVMTYPLIWAGLLLAVAGISTVSLSDAVIGAAAGYMSLWSVYWGFKLLTGKDGMGFGDFKLFAAFGAWFGWQALPLIILLSSLVGAVLGIIIIVAQGKDRNLQLPFGPYLCGAALVYFFFGEAITTAYLSSFV